MLICRSFLLRGVDFDNGGASAVRADLSIAVSHSQVRSNDVEVSTVVG
jgi:hypothetical protein